MNTNESAQQEKNKIFFLKGKKVYLRPLELSDTERCARWINDPETRVFLASIYPINTIQEREFIEKDEKGKVVKLAIETKDGKHIGIISLGSINWVNQTASTGTLIGEKEYLGKGYGTEAKMLLLEYAFNTLGLRKIHSSAFAFNKRSIKYSLKCGYKIIGTQKAEVLRNGKYCDMVLLEVFKKDWQIAHKKWIS